MLKTLTIWKGFVTLWIQYDIRAKTTDAKIAKIANIEKARHSFIKSENKVRERYCNYVYMYILGKISS